MTNLVSATGLRAVSRYSDAGFVGALKPFHLRSDYNQDMFRGDPVLQVATGSNLAPSGITGGTYVGGMTNMPIGSVPDINLATAGATHKFMGAIHSVGYNPQNPDIQYGPASTDRYVLCTYDPSIEYEVMSNGAASAHTYSDINNNANLASGTGDKVFGNSGWVLDQGSLGTDATYQLTIISVVYDSQRNDMTAANPSFIVINNLHTQYNAAVAGV